MPQNERESVARKPRLSVHQLRELVNQGQRMSNWLYNINQWASVPAELREEARMLQESWDNIRRGEKCLLRTHKVEEEVR